MDVSPKETGDIPEKWWSAPASPIERLHKFSKNAVKRASDSWHGSSPRSPNTPNSEQEVGHRRTRSDLSSSFPRSVSPATFQKWKYQVQKALYWRSRSFCCEDRQYPSFDPEMLADQKRQWYKIQSKASDPDKFKEPASLFEHFIIVGLRPDTNLEVVEDAIFKRKMLEQEMSGNDQMPDFNTGRSHEPTSSTLEPQVLFKYPAATKLALRLKDLASFCFPGGVKASILKRTPSLSELNELLYGQGHLYSEESSFIFSVKVADSATLYGVCLHVQEFVQEPPVMPGVSSPVSQPHSGRRRRYLVSAPRCYCILTRVPFFELHFEILNSIAAQKHLNRISQFVNDASLSDYVPTSPSMPRNHHTTGNADSPRGESDADWASTETPVDSVLTVPSATAAGIVLDDEVAAPTWEICSPGSVSASDLADHSQFDKGGGKINNMHAFDQFSEISFSSAVSMASDEDIDEIFYNPGSEDIGVESARDNKNDLLHIINSYHSMHVPPRGCEILFQPLEHLKPIVYHRPPVSNLGFCEKYLDRNLEDSNGVSQVNIKLAGAEEALALSLWSTATICRALSLENVLALVTSVLLEKQVVILCPNLGVLSAVALSLIPIIRPFEWQSLFLPYVSNSGIRVLLQILPLTMLDFIDAPVPFIVGLQHKPDDLMMKASHTVQVNVEKNEVKSRDLPQLPKYKELMSELRPIHAALSCVDYVSQRHPVYKCDKVQTKAAEQFLVVIRQYMESLCSGLRLHTITSVQSNNDRVSILHRDSFIDSFPVMDQHFVKLFVETQMFTVLSDSQLSSFDNEH